MNDDITKIIGEIMANPGFGSLVNQLKNSTAESSSAPQQNASPSPTSLSPEMAEKIPEILGMLGQSGIRPPSASPDKAVIEKALGALKKTDTKNCEKLLSALKPYLRSQRGEVIDKAVSMMKLTDLLGAVSQTQQATGNGQGENAKTTD